MCLTHLPLQLQEASSCHSSFLCHHWLSFPSSSITFLQVCNKRTININYTVFLIHMPSQMTTLPSCWHPSLPAPFQPPQDYHTKQTARPQPPPSSLPFICRAYSKIPVESTLTSSMQSNNTGRADIPFLTCFKKNNNTSHHIFYNTTISQHNMS